MKRILIAGCGKIGSRVGIQLVQRGCEVYGIRRDTSSIPATIHPLRANFMIPKSLTCIPPGLDCIYCILTADEFNDDAYKNIYVTGLGNLVTQIQENIHKSTRIIFVSSTSVYGQENGEKICWDLNIRVGHKSRTKELNDMKM